jgi:hypothetical protein
VGWSSTLSVPLIAWLVVDWSSNWSCSRPARGADCRTVLAGWPYWLMGWFPDWSVRRFPNWSICWSIPNAGRHAGFQMDDSYCVGRFILPIPEIASDEKIARWNQVRNPHPFFPHIAAGLGNIPAQRHRVFKLG